MPSATRNWRPPRRHQRRDTGSAGRSGGRGVRAENVHNEININDRNRLHPYYLVYLTEEGEIVYDHLSPRSTLETMRQLCHGKTEPIQALCRAFNEETRCGEEMQLYSDLLEEAVLSIVDAKEDSDLDSLFRAGGTTALLNQISGLDDFELICFLVVKEG